MFPETNPVSVISFQFVVFFKAMRNFWNHHFSMFQDGDLKNKNGGCNTMS